MADIHTDELMSYKMPFNEEQMKVIAKLRSEALPECERYGIPESHISDLFIMRFFLGNKADYDAALEQLLSTIKLRSELNITLVRDMIEQKGLLDHPEGIAECDLLKTVMQVLTVHPGHGRDHRGVPVTLMATSDLHPDHLVNMGIDAFIFAYLGVIEYRMCLLDRESLKKGELLKQVMVLDFKGLGFSHLRKDAVKFVTEVGQYSERMYPEMLERIYVINQGWVLSAAWAIIKTVLSETTKNAVVFCKKNYNEELSGIIDMESAPINIGGACNCMGNDDCVYNLERDALSEKVSKAHEEWEALTGRSDAEEDVSEVAPTKEVPAIVPTKPVVMLE